MKKKALLATIIAAAMLSAGIPAAAEEKQTETPAAELAAPETSVRTFTSEDGVLSILLPDENWKEMEDPAKWIVLSDGANVITIDHFSNGENLPDMSVADEHYVNVYQAVFSTQNEVFIITGYVVDADMIPDVAKTIISTKVLKYDTKVAVKKQEQPDAASYSVAPLNKTMYVTSNGLNIRAESNTDSAVIGGLGYGQAVNVTGSVQQNGQDIGWYQVSYDGKTGYVSASFLSDTQPAAKEEKKASEEVSYTGAAVTIYAMTGTALTIYQASDGNWYDKTGQKYTWVTGDKLSSEGGDSFTTYNPNGAGSNLSSIYVSGSPFQVFWLNGNGDSLTPYSDGSFYSSGGVKYWSNGNGTYSGEDGTTLYATAPDLDSDSGSSVIPLKSEGSGRPAIISQDANGSWTDGEGHVYDAQQNGTWVNELGDVYIVG